jgi:thioredoxin
VTAIQRTQCEPWAERELVLRAKAREPRARDELLEAFLPLIGSVARLYRGAPGIHHRELMQDGVVGLLRALDRFDPALGTPFWAYASWWVRQAMQQLVSELGRPVVLSDRAVRLLARVKRAQRCYEQERGGEPTAEELSGLTGLPRAQIEHLIVAARRPRGLEERLGRGDATSATYGELLADPQAEEAYEDVPRRDAVAVLPVLLDELDDRERAILGGRFGLDGPERTLRELAATLGVSAERVRQLEQRALGKLREAVDPPLTAPAPDLPQTARSDRRTRMSSPAVIACTNCGRRNRVPVVASGVPRCSVCHHPLPWIVDADAESFQGAIDASIPVLVDFWAAWCGPCRMISPIVEKVGTEHAGRLKVVKLDVDQAGEVAARHGAQSIPLLVLFSGGEEVDRMVGAVPERVLRDWLEPHLSPVEHA